MKATFPCLEIKKTFTRLYSATKHMPSCFSKATQWKQSSRKKPQLVFRAKTDRRDNAVISAWSVVAQMLASVHLCKGGCNYYVTDFSFLLKWSVRSWTTWEKPGWMQHLKTAEWQSHQPRTKGNDHSWFPFSLYTYARIKRASALEELPKPWSKNEAL